MHSHKDIENKSIFIINGTENQCFKVQSGFLCLKNSETNTTITKLPFPKMLCIIIIGHTTITTAFIEHANRHGVPIVVMKPNFRPVYHFGTMSESNYLLRQTQHAWDKSDLSIAKQLVQNKWDNCAILLSKTKKKTREIAKFEASYEKAKMYLAQATDLRKVMAAEGRIASYYFSAYFDFLEWDKRVPRCKIDELNALMDIGYTMLFHYIEANCRLFGFDLYIGVYHQLWFQRKSLVCDLVEPFRCIIERCIYLNFKSGKMQKSDFELFKGSYILKKGRSAIYTKLFYDAIISYKLDIYKYIQNYYRCFKGNKHTDHYPTFKI